MVRQVNNIANSQILANARRHLLFFLFSVSSAETTPLILSIVVPESFDHMIIYRRNLAKVKLKFQHGHQPEVFMAVYIKPQVIAKCLVWVPHQSNSQKEYDCLLADECTEQLWVRCPSLSIIELNNKIAKRARNHQKEKKRILQSCSPKIE